MPLGVLGLCGGVVLGFRIFTGSWTEEQKRSLPGARTESRNAQPVSQSTPVVTGSLIDRLRAGTVFGGMGTTDTQSTVQVPLASNASSTQDAEQRTLREYYRSLLNLSRADTSDGDMGAL